ncbi:tripartite tricarboxylate transporter substrate-binding protein [Variovorax sp. LT1R16]|uniref:tripartite tricarboxylate transporter substrate-binding protein n=1 Tax=Variovorax sp. LT1R16 TaxID=3443728 RepID=UPI003F458140
MALKGTVAAALAAAGDAWAQPASITLLVGYNAGSTPDTVARLIGRFAGLQLHRSVIVDNRGGAGGQIALSNLKNSAADGSFLALTPASPLSLFPSTYKKLPYSPLEDFAPICSTCAIDFAFAVPASHPAKTLAEFIKWAKKNGSDGNIGNPGTGTAPHFLAWALKKAAGLEVPDVPYRNTPQIALELAAGSLSSGIAAAALFAEFVKAGKIRVLATSGVQRNLLYPHSPTFAEEGFGSLTTQEWYCLMMRSSVPRAASDLVFDAMRSLVGNAAYREGLAGQGMLPVVQGRAWMTERLKAETEHWREVVKATGFVAD